MDDGDVRKSSWLPPGSLVPKLSALAYVITKRQHAGASEVNKK